MGLLFLIMFFLVYESTSIGHGVGEAGIQYELVGNKERTPQVAVAYLVDHDEYTVCSPNRDVPFDRILGTHRYWTNLHMHGQNHTTLSCKLARTGFPAQPPTL